MIFAPGTPQSVIAAAEKEWLSGKSKKPLGTSLPPKPKPMTAKEKRDALRAEAMKKQQERQAAAQFKQNAKLAEAKAKQNAKRAEAVIKEQEMKAAVMEKFPKSAPKPQTSSGGDMRPPGPPIPKELIDPIRPMPRDSGTGSGDGPRTTIDPNAPRRPEIEGGMRPPGGMKKGGMVKESAMMKKEGRGMAKANMQKIAGAAVKKHEKAMHGMKSGGMASKRADGIAQRGKTKGRIV